MKALSPYAVDTSGSRYTNEDYAQWWVQGASLYQELASIPVSEVDAVGMRARYDQLVGRWAQAANVKGGIVPPEALGPFVDEQVIGNLRMWIKQAKTLIYYIAYDERGGSSNDRQYSAPGTTTEPPGNADGIDIAENISEIPGYTQGWHWPWIEGWDDPQQRRALLNPKSDGGKIKKMVIAIGVSGVAIWAAQKFLSRAKNPEDPPQEDYE